MSLPHPRAGKDTEHVVNGDAWLAIGYLTGFFSIFFRQRVSIFAACTDCTVVQDLDLKKKRLDFFHLGISSKSSRCLPVRQSNPPSSTTFPFPFEFVSFPIGWHWESN